MDGDIKVDSEYQKGSTFTVTIPQKIISDEATGDFNSIMSRQRARAARRQESFEAPGANVLVVDDNSMNDELLKHLSELKKGLDTFEADKAETLLTEMDKFVYQGSSVSELLHDARQDVEDFELSAAAEKVEALMLHIEQ